MNSNDNTSDTSSGRKWPRGLDGAAAGASPHPPLSFLGFSVFQSEVSCHVFVSSVDKAEKADGAVKKYSQGIAEEWGP